MFLPVAGSSSERRNLESPVRLSSASCVHDLFSQQGHLLITSVRITGLLKEDTHYIHQNQNSFNWGGGRYMPVFLCVFFDKFLLAKVGPPFYQPYWWQIIWQRLKILERHMCYSLMYQYEQNAKIYSYIYTSVYKRTRNRILVRLTLCRAPWGICLLA